jgi:hypothetical protein
MLKAGQSGNAVEFRHFDIEHGNVGAPRRAAQNEISFSAKHLTLVE